VMFLDFAEDQARRRKEIFLHQWPTRLDDFLRLNDRAILPDAGKVTREHADAVAEAAYEQFAERRRAMTENTQEADTLKELEEAIAKLPSSEKGRGTKA
jgi:hypothetical protein